MHRWIWDLHYTAPISSRHEYPIAAVPHDTPRYPMGPTALPGSYTVRLAVDGKTSSAPLTVKMDPRVKTAPAGLLKKFEAETRLAATMSESTEALLQGGSIRDQLGKVPAEKTGAVNVEPYQKKLGALLGNQGGFFAPPSPDVTLGRVSGQAGTLYQQIWQADAAPTSSQADALTSIERDSADVMKRWNEFKKTDLPALNQLLHQAQVPEIQIETDLHHDEPQGDEE